MPVGNVCDMRIGRCAKSYFDNPAGTEDILSKATLNPDDGFFEVNDVLATLHQAALQPCKAKKHINALAGGQIL